MSLISKGQTLISNIELGSLKQEVPFEIHSDYTGKSTLTDSRQLRLNVKPSENTISNTYVNMGIDNQYGNQFYISCPVTDATISGDKAFTIDNSKKTTIPNSSNISELNTLSVQNSYIHDIYVPEYAKNEIISVNGTLLLQNNVFAPNTWETISNIASGMSHTFLLTPTGNVYAAGSNQYGELGIDNENQNLNVFTRLLNPNPEPGREGEYLSNVKLIGCAGNSSYYTTFENEFYAFGRNQSKQLGLGPSSAGTYTTPQSVSTSFTSNIVEISSHYKSSSDFWPTFVSILTEDGSVYIAGSNSNYRAGMPTQYGTYSTFTAAPSPADSNVKKIINGLQNSMIIKNDGSVYGCGVSSEWQLGVNTSATQYIQLGTIASQQTVSIQIGQSITQVCCGQNHTMALDINGTVWVTGDNQYGQLGLGDYDNRNTFTSITGLGSITELGAYYNSSFVRSGGQLYSCGNNYYGQLGLGDNDNRNTFTSVTGLNNVTHLFSAPEDYYRSLIITSGGAVKHAGYGYWLNISDHTQFTSTGYSQLNSDVVHISTNPYSAIFVKSNGTAYGYGYAGEGTFGSTANGNVYGYQLTYSGSVITNAVMSVMHDRSSNILRSDGSVIGSGRNFSLALGLGYSTSSTYVTYTLCSSIAQSGVTQISGANSFSIMLKNGTVYGAGSNSNGEFADGGNAQGPFVTIPSSPTTVVFISAGKFFTYLLTSNGDLYRSGKNDYGQLGLFSDYSIQTSYNNIISSFIPFTNVKSGYFHERCTHVLLENGSLYGTGRNYNGALGTGYSNIQTGFTAIPGNGSSDVVDISGGEYFSSLKKSDNRIYFSGSSVGNSGGSSVFTLYSSISNVDKISCGPFSISILNNNGQILGMGQNTNGNLGVGNFINSGTFNYYTLVNNPNLASFIYKTHGDYNGLYNFNGLYSDLSIKCYDYLAEVFINQQYGARVTSDGRMFASSFIPFTGVHMSNNRKEIESGLIVSIIPSNLNKSFQDIKLSNIQMDCNVIGVMSGSDTFNSLGEGGIWVSDINGTISSGDYITSSILHGYGQKQDSDFMENYTVAKIIQNCYFNEHENLRYLSLSDDCLTLDIVPKEEYLLNPDKYFRAQFVGCTYHCG